MGEQPDNSIINSEEERQRAKSGDPEQNAAADGLEAGLEALRLKNESAAASEEAPQPRNTGEVSQPEVPTGTQPLPDPAQMEVEPPHPDHPRPAAAPVAPPTEAPQAASEPAQPPQAPVAVAEAPAAPQAAPGEALGLDTPAKTITSAGVVVAPVKEEALSPTVRKFACAKQPNGRKLVRAGAVQRVVDPSSPSGRKDFARDGDKWVVFNGGLSQETRDLEVIQFCEGHPDIYDVNDPASGLKFDLEKLQIPTATREAMVIPGSDIAKVLSGESDEGLVGDSPIAAARRQVQEANQRI